MVGSVDDCFQKGFTVLLERKEGKKEGEKKKKGVKNFPVGNAEQGKQRIRCACLAWESWLLLLAKVRSPWKTPKNPKDWFSLSA